MPELTRPNMACFPSNHCVGPNVMKNCEPFVSGPELAIDKMPAPKNDETTLIIPNPHVNVQALLLKLMKQGLEVTMEIRMGLCTVVQ